MTAPPDPEPSDLLATAGGNATAGGVTFQAEVGAGFAVRLLAERRLNERFGLGDAKVRTLRFETEAPVDDILIETDAGGWIFVQAKSTLTLSTTADSELGSVPDRSSANGMRVPKALENEVGTVPLNQAVIAS